MRLDETTDSKFGHFFTGLYKFRVRVSRAREKSFVRIKQFLMKYERTRKFRVDDIGVLVNLNKILVTSTGISDSLYQNFA